MLMPRLRNRGYAEATSCELVLSTRTVLEPELLRNSASLGSGSGASVEAARVDVTLSRSMDRWSVL
jgi:hypothetical protein